MDKPEPMFNDDQPEEENWDNTDGAIQDLLWEVSPVELVDFDSFVKDMREYMLSQFESREIADRDIIHSYMENDEEDDDILDELDENNYLID